MYSTLNKYLKFIKQGCQPYIIEACEHHTTGDRPPCSEGGGTPKCMKTCDAGYTIPYQQDLHFGNLFNSIF